MIYHTYLPRSPLSQFVAFLWSSEGDNLPKAQVRLLPIGSMELVINLRSDAIPLFERHSRARCGSTSGSRICGIHSESFIIDNDSQVSVMGLHFKPGGSAPFFALPARELHNQIVSLDELWNHRAGELRDLPEAAALRYRLLEAPTLETRFLVLERFLLTLMAQPPERHPAVDFALREFGRCLTTSRFASTPMPTVGAVTDKIGLSARHFGQLFRDAVGLTPKLFCRVQRLRQVLYLLAFRGRQAPQKADAKRVLQVLPPRQIPSLMTMKQTGAARLVTSRILCMVKKNGLIVETRPLSKCYLNSIKATCKNT